MFKNRLEPIFDTASAAQTILITLEMFLSDQDIIILLFFHLGSIHDTLCIFWSEFTYGL